MNLRFKAGRLPRLGALVAAVERGRRLVPNTGRTQPMQAVNRLSGAAIIALGIYTLATLRV